MTNNNNSKSPKPIVQKILIIVGVLIFINLLTSVWLAYEFYVQSANSVCSINAIFDCVTVAQSEYAIFLGVPVAIWGIIFYTGLLIGTLGYAFRFPFHKIIKPLKPKIVFKLIRWFVSFGVLFSFYLTFVEAFVIGVYCPFCLLQQALILVIVGLLLWAKKKSLT